MSNNTRTLRNRSSRYSSPATFTTINQESLPPGQDSNAGQGTVEDGVDRQSQSQAQQGPWVEPVVRNGVPSFEDTRGLERVGVLEHMQPLGAAPNPKLLQKLKVSLGNRVSLGSARATPVYSEGLASPASQPTELARHGSPSPVIDPELLDSPSPPITQGAMQSQSPAVFPSHHLQDSQPSTQPLSSVQSVPPPQLQSPISQTFPSFSQNQYGPTSPFPQLPLRPDPTLTSYTQQPSPQIIMSPPRGRPAKKEVEEMRAYNPDDSMISPAMASIMRPSRASPRYSSSFSDQNRGDRFRTALQNAIDRAAAEGKPEIEAGLQKVLQESGRDELTTALDNISKYKANVPINQFKVFKHFVKKGIRKHRKTSSQSSILSNDDRDSSLVSSRPIGHFSTFQTKRHTSHNKDREVENHVGSPPALRSGHHVKSSDTSPTKTDHASPQVVEVTDLTSQTDQPAQRFPLVISRKRRSSSTSSLSSLSSGNLSDYTPPEMAVPVKDQTGEGRPARSATQRQAPSRTAAAGRPTRLSGIGTDPNSQSQSFHQQTPLDYTGVDNSSTHKTKRQKLINVDSPADEEIDRQKANLRKNVVRDSAYEQRTSFSRTPSPDRRTKKEEQEQKRRLRGLSPRPSRQRAGPPPPVIHPEALTQSTNFEPSSPVSAQGDGPPTNGASRKRDYEEFMRDDHSDQLSSLGPTPPPPPAATRASVNTRASVGASSTRASTPRLAKEPNRPSRSRRVRVMNTSPQKPKDGMTTAGVPGEARAGVDQEFAVANGEGLENFNGDSHHGEECRACGDVGTLLCCDGDGCLNAFHGDCLEPPVDPDDPSIDLWFCPECEKRRKPLEAQGDNQLMGALISHVSTAAPRAYTLPSDVRNYFENVKTGEDGEYVEVPPPPTNKKGAPKADHHGALKLPNFKELKDAKGNTRFCYKCNGTTEGTRDIIPCDFCPNEWHLDCLDPPLATAPRRFDPNGKSPQNWRCPLHVDHDLKNVAHAQHAVPGQMGRIPRLRYPKKHISVTPKEFFNQNPTNNGLIDPVLEPEEQPLEYKTIIMQSAVFKIPEKQIKHDFIAKARRDFYKDHAIPVANGQQPRIFHSKAWTPDGARLRAAPIRYDEMDYEESDVRDFAIGGTDIHRQPAGETRLHRKSFVEQQTVLALLDLAKTDTSTNTSNHDAENQDSLTDLVHQLIADAPPNVVEQINLSEEQQLQKLIDLAQQRMSSIRRQSEQPRMSTEVSTQKKVSKPTTNGKINHNGQNLINGITLGHDHGDD